MKYFLLCFVEVKNGDKAFMSLNYTTDDPIDTLSDIRELENTIAEKNGFNGVLIMNWKKLS